MSCYFLASKTSVLILFLCFVALKLILELCTRVIFKSCLPQKPASVTETNQGKLEMVGELGNNAKS